MDTGSEDDEDDAGLRRRTEDIADSERLHTQQDALAAVWTGLRRDGADIVVLLTDPEPYEERLLALVEHPDRVRFQRSTHTHTHSDLERIRDDVVELVDDTSWTSHGLSLEHVHITLRANRTGIAEHLHQRFGDILEITLGRHRYPLDPTDILEPPPFPVSTIDLPDLVCSVEPDQPSWAPGEDIWGEIRLSNDGDEPVMVAGHSVGVLLDRDGGVVGEYSGGLLLGLQVKTIAPGAQDTIRFTAGSDTSDPRLGAALPPGTYDLVIPLGVYDIASTGRRIPGRPRTLVTPGSPLRLDAPRH